MLAEVDYKQNHVTVVITTALFTQLNVDDKCTQDNAHMKYIGFY